MVELFANIGDPDQTLHSAASDLDLHYLPNTLLGISRLQWVKVSSVAQLNACLTEEQEVVVWPQLGWQHSFVEIDYEIFSMVILFLPLIQEGQLSVSGKRICTVLVNHLED